MSRFDEYEYRKQWENIYGARDYIEKTADQVLTNKAGNIILIGTGGTWGQFYAIKQIMEYYTSMEIILENPAEFRVKRSRKYLSRDSLILTASVSGDTSEIVSCMELAGTFGIKTVSFTQDKLSPVAVRSDYPVEVPNEEMYLLLMMFALRLLYGRGEFAEYPRWAEQMRFLGENIAKILKEEQPRLSKAARSYRDEKFSLWTSSGILWGNAFVNTCCVFEEMQKIPSQPVNSAEFFHGPLELVDENLLVYVLLGEDEYRPLDERVLAFVKRYTEKIVVFDSKQYELESISDEFRLIVSPIIMEEVLFLLAKCFEEITGIPLDEKRYYKKVSY